MIEWSARERWMSGWRLSVGFSAAAGACEAAWIAATTHAPIGALGAFLLAVEGGVLTALVGALLGLIAGLTHRATRSQTAPTAIALHGAVTILLLTLIYALPPAVSALAEGLRAVAVVTMLLPLAFMGMAFFNTRFWLRRVEVGAEYPVGALGAGGIVAALASLAAAGFAVLVPGLREPLPKAGPSIVLVTIDTLRRDAVGVYGGAGTPNLDQLAIDGTVFDNAVTPMPETAPAHASMFTGLHPLRHRVISNSHPLSGGFVTVAETLSDGEYATGAFVSSFAVDHRSGLGSGFTTYDDSLAPAVCQLAVLRPWLRLWTRFGDPARTPWLLERSGAVTVARFDTWLSSHPNQKLFAWVHLFEPHAPYEGGPVDHRARMGDDFSAEERQQLIDAYHREVNTADTYVGEVLASLDRHGMRDNTLVIVLGDHGEMLGEHGMMATHAGLYDEVVRIPLLMRIPGERPGRVAPQVRSMDIAPTILAFADVKAKGEMEGFSLLEYASGRRSRSLGTTLIGRTTRNHGYNSLIGARHEGVKYIRGLGDGAEQVYLVADDPLEQKDLALWYVTNAPKDIEKLRQLVEPDVVAFDKLLGATPTDRGQGPLLDALGYRE